MEKTVKLQQINSQKIKSSKRSPLFVSVLLSSALVLSSGCGLNPFRRSTPSYEGPMTNELESERRISLSVGGEWRSIGNGVKIRVNKVRRFRGGERKGEIATINIDIKKGTRYFQNNHIIGASGGSIYFPNLKIIILPTKGRKIKLAIIEQ